MKKHFIIPRSEVSYGFVKGLKEMASPVTLAYTFVKKYAEGNYGGILSSASGDMRLLAVLDITHLYTENPKEPGWLLFFHGSALQ